MVGKKEQPKSIEQYRQEKPVQLTLFELLSPEDRRYSNTIELYDFIPKYHWGKTQRINGQFLKQLDREFACRGKRYRVKIKPASLEDKNGTERYHYPSQREELVEDALRKFVCEGQGVFLDDEAGVSFTLYQLQQELAQRGHTYNLDELKAALLICANTKLEIKTEDGSITVVSSIFQTLGLQTREDWQKFGQKTRAFVRFNPLVTQSIKSRNFRQLDYNRSMTFKSVIARQLYKRLSHHYVQASWQHPYTINLLTIIRDFGLTKYEKLPNNLRDVIAALEEMKKADVIMSYEVERITDEKRRNKLLDAQLTMLPHPSFSGEQKAANKRKSDIEGKAAALQLPPAPEK
ncbi:MAG: hypothetical protein WBP93_14880 [Pyrinomonadaceae bacterium]